MSFFDEIRDQIGAPAADMPATAPDVAPAVPSSANPTVGEFVAQVAPAAIEAGKRLGVDPSILIGQWGLETGWGKSVIPDTNNLGNIKDFSGSGIAATDNMTGSRDRYRQYASINDFGSDYAGLIERRYGSAIGAGQDVARYAEALKAGGYAEDPAYVEKMARAAEMVRGAVVGLGEGWNGAHAGAGQQGGAVSLEPDSFLASGFDALERRDRQEASDESPMSTNLSRGWRQMSDSLGNYVSLLEGDEAAIVERLQEAQKFDAENPMPTATAKFYQDWTDENYLTAMINVPGFAGGMVEQLANSLPSMIGSIPGMIAGGAMGAAAGPVGVLLGATAGGALGSAPGSVALETGARISAMAGKAGVDVSNPAAFQAWLTENRDAIVAEGMSKGLTVAAMDGVAGGIGSAIIARPALRLQQAERRILERMGINGADDFAVAAARRTPQYQTAIKPFKAEFDVANTAGANAMRGFASFAAESMGEFGGEYAGEVAATGEGNFNEALLEGVMGAGQSAITTGAQFAAQKVIQPNSPLTNAANMATAGAPPAAPGAPAGAAGQGAAADPTARLAELEAITNGTPAQTVMGPNGQPVTIPGAQPRLFTQQEQDEYRALKAQMGGTSPAADQQGAASDPLAQRVSAVASIVEDKALISSLRSDPRFGKESVTDLLAAYAKARNPNLDPLIRTQALDSIDAFMRTFENRPNFTMGGARAAQGGEQPASSPDLFWQPTPQLEAPAFAERDITPRAPTPELETDQILQARRTADAEYDQAFQDLVKAEQLGASDAELMEYQQALEDAKQARAELDAELEAVQRRIEDGRKKQTAEKRRAILDDILADPQTANPAARFTAELQRQGFRDIVPDSDEMATIQRFEGAREAVTSLPAEAAPVQQARPVQAAKPVQTDGNASQDGNVKPRPTVDRVKQAVAAGASLDGNMLRAPGAEPIALQGPMLAAAREAVRRREAGPALNPVAQGVRDAVESGGLARPNVVSQPQQGGVTNDVPTAEQVAPQAQEAGGQEGEASKRRFVGLAAYNITNADPLKAGDSALSRDDALFELDVLQDRADRGKLTPDAFAQSGIAQRLDTAQMMTINDSIRAGDFSFIGALKSRIEQAQQPTQAPAAQEGAATGEGTGIGAVAEQPTQAPTAPEQSRPEPGRRSEPAQPDTDAAVREAAFVEAAALVGRTPEEARAAHEKFAAELGIEEADRILFANLEKYRARAGDSSPQDVAPRADGDLREDIARAYIRGRHERYGHSLGEPTSNDYAFADDIINKNVYALEHLANGMNDVAKAVFEQFTGVKLPKQQGKTWRAMLEWAGVTPEQDAVREALRRVAVEEKALEGQFANLDAGMVWAADRVAEGFDTISKLASGDTWLTRADGNGFNLSKRGTRLNKLQPLLRAHINLKAARKALEDAERSTNTATQEESTDAGTGQEDGQEWSSAALRAPEGEGIGRPAGPWSLEDLNENPALYRSAGEYLDARASDGTILVKSIDATLADRDAALGLALPGMDRPALPSDLMIAFIEDAPIKGDLKPSDFDPKYTLRYAGHTLDLEMVELEPGDVVLGLPPLVLHEGYDRRDGDEFAPLSAYRVPGVDGLFDFVDAVEQGYAILAQRAGQSPAGVEMDADIAEQFADAAEPTDGQKDAGNYQMAHIRIDGMDVSIETEKGARRTGTDANGTAWAVTMPSSYGYIRGTKGADKDHVDIFVGPNPDNGTYYVINQNKPNTYGTKKRFDEHKVAVGFASENEAVANYLLSFADDFGARVFGSVAGPYTADEFKALIPQLEKASPIEKKERKAKPLTLATPEQESERFQLVNWLAYVKALAQPKRADEQRARARKIADAEKRLAKLPPSQYSDEAMGEWPNDKFEQFKARAEINREMVDTEVREKDSPDAVFDHFKRALPPGGLDSLPFSREYVLHAFQKKAEAGTVRTRRIKVDDMPAVEVTLPSGNVYRMNRLTGAESMGLAGWHDMDRDRHSFLGDNQELAIQALIEREAGQQARAAEEAAKPAEFMHNGIRIYPTTVNVGGERKAMWGVESAENKAKREAGERYGFGDSLFDTQDQAMAAADRQIRDDAARAERDQLDAEIAELKQARAEARNADTVNGFTAGKSAMEAGRIKTALDKQYRFDGKDVMSVRARIESLYRAGTLEASSFDEPKIKPMSRTQFNRATQREQDAHEKKMREAGTKTVYLVNDTDLGKIGHDYAQHLLTHGIPAAVSEVAQQQAVSESSLRSAVDRGLPNGYSVASSDGDSRVILSRDGGYTVSLEVRAVKGAGFDRLYAYVSLGGKTEEAGSYPNPADKMDDAVQRMFDNIEMVVERLDRGRAKRQDVAPNIPEPKNWRTSYGAAQKYAEALGVNPRGEDGKYLKLPALVAAIEAKRGGATAAKPSSDFPVSLDVKTFIATFPEFNEFGLSQVWMNEDGSIERSVSDYELDTAVLQRYTKSDFLNAYRDGRVRETVVEARRGAGSADVALTNEGEAEAIKKRGASDEVDSESARRAEFPLSGGADAKVTETARRGEFDVKVAGERYGSFVLDDNGNVSGVRARTGATERYVREAANTFAAMQRGETTNVADAAQPPSTGVAPGTRINSDAERAAADRLQQVLDAFDADRNTPEGAARTAIRSVIEELRKPRTAVSVTDLLETASDRMMRKYGALARVVDEVAEQISGAAVGAQQAEAGGQQTRGADRESNQERSEREWAENFDRVANAPDIAALSTSELERAAGYASKVIGNGKASPAIVDAMRREEESIRFELNRRYAERDARAAAAPAPSALDAAAAALSDKKLAAAEKLKRLLASRRGTLNSGVDPELMLAVAELGAISIAEGAVKFAQWARDLIRATRAVGIDDDQVKPFMKEAYGAIAANPEKYDLTDEQADSMDALREVRRADVDALIDDNEGEAVNEQDGDDSGDDGALAPVSPRELQDAEGGKSAREGSGGLRGSDADGDGRAAEVARNERDGGLAGEPGAVLPEGSDGDGVEQVEISGEHRSLEEVAESVKNDPPASEPKPKFPARFGDNPGNYAITDADALGTGTPGERIRANLAAVRLVLELERENRYPTREEQATLAKYVGWGGLKNVFKGDNSTSKQEREAYAELKRILTPDQLFWMGQSVLNAHYTSPKVVGAMYRVLRHFGIEGGRFLEPTVGTGNFIGLMPADMAASAKWFASEIDPITSLIAKNLYPDAQILPATGFQDAEFAYGRMDVAIGNPPFGDERITDTNKKRAEISGFKIHNYVISKSAMHLRPGGIMSFVVTSRFLDTANPEAREYLAKNFKFIGAFRLPNDAFAENAGTEVTTDIIFLQRLRGEQRDGVTADDMPWLDTKGRMLNQDNETVTLNRYFAENPGMLLGKPSMQGTMYGSRSERGEFTLQPIPGMDFAEEIDRILENEWAPLKGIGKARPAEANEAAAAIVLNREDVPIGGYFREGERVVQRVDDDADGNVQFRELTPETPWTEKQTLGATRLGRIKGMLTLREMAYDLMADERADAPAEILKTKRAELNRVYDKFVDDFGFLNDAANKALMDDDPRIEFGLEGDYTKAITAAAAKRLGQAQAPATAQKSSLLKERVFYPKQEIDRADSPADGYAISLSEKGQLDLEYIAEITDMPMDAVIADLSAGDKPLIFKDPVSGRWVQEDEYLSGDVKDKLKLARGAGLEANVRALEAIQPKDVPLSEIHAEFGATWLPASVYEDFLRLLGYDAPRVAVLPKSGVVDVTSVGNLGTSHFRADIENDDYTVAEVFSAVASRRQLVAYDGRGDDRRINQQRTENLGRIRNKMIAIWSDWIKSDPERGALIERQYNALMNTTVERQYDGVTHLRTVGANPAVDLRNSQKISAWRMIQSPITLLDHVVGAGKTMALITGIMERRRLGLSKKPIVVVPNHLVGQWARDWIQLYPGANILAATEKDFKKSNRRRLFARIATGKFDAVIVGHSSFGFIPVSRESELEFIRGEVRHLEAALTEAEMAEGGKKGKGDSRRVRGIKNRIAKRMEKIRELQDKPRDNVVTFEDMGIDYLAVDELHEFKNLEYATTLSNVAGMGSPEGAKKSFDLFMKMRLLQAAGGGIAGATGTPISNSMVEMYSLLRYLNPDALAARGMEQFDAWVKAFASIEPRDEYTAAGKIKQRTVLAAFNNLPELLQMYKQVADTVTMTDLKRIYAEQVRAENARLAGESRPKPEAFPVPKVAGGGRRLDIGEPTEEQVEFMDYLIARADVLDKLKGKQRQEYAKTDNALWLMNDARKMSLDVRIINPTLPDNPNNKVNRAAKNIRAIYDKWDAERGTQLVFCDLSTPVKTAAKDANAFIRGAVKALGLDGDRAIEAAIEEKSYADKWAFLESRADLMLESGTLSDARREGIESFLEKVGDDELSALQVADSGFSVYDALKAKLIESGIPEREIAFIHDANTADQKRELFDLVNAGKVRVLIGSSAKMGAGTNVQKRIVALHHMDAPWRPSDIEQREGRAIRQGNLIAFDKDGHPIRKDFELEIIAYSTERTFDAQMWGVLSRKAAFLEQFRMGLRSIKEVGGDAASYAEFMAEATGDQIFRDKLNLERELVDIEAEDRSAKMKRSAAERLVDSADGKIFTAEAELKSAQRAAAADLSSVEFRGETYRNDIAEVIEAEVALYREELAAYEEQEQAYKVARKAWEDAAGTERGRAPTKPQSPEVPELSAERVEAKSEWARFVNDLTKRMSMQGEGEANYGLKTADGQTIFLRVFKGEKSDSVQVLIDDSMIAWGAPRSPGVASRLMPGRLAGELKQAAEGRKESLKRLRANIDQAKVTLEQVKPVDPQRIADLRARYEAVKTQVDQISERMAIERAQRRNRFISRDSKRFPLGVASVPAPNSASVPPAPSASAQQAPAAQKAKSEPRFRFAGGSVSAVYGVEDVAFDGLGDYTFYTIADGEELNQTWYVIENGTGLSVGKGETRAAAIKAFKDIIKNRGLGNVREVIQKADQITENERRKAIKAADADPSVLRATPGTGVDFEPVSLEVAAGVVAGIRPTAEEVWKVELRLVPSFDALPQEAKDEIARDYGPDERPKGLLSGDVVYVIADQHDSASDVEATILHEIKGHVGVRRFYGADITRELNKLFLQIGGARGLKQLADERNIDLGDYAAALATSKHSDDVRVRIMMEELLAHLAEAPRFMDRVKAIVGQLRAWLRKMGWVELPKMGQTDLLWILKQADRKLGEPGPDGGPRGGKTPAVKRNGNYDPAEPSIVLRKGGNAMAGRAVDSLAKKLPKKVGDYLQYLFNGDTAKTFNWYHKTVGSQFHKAKIDPQHYGRVFTLAQQFIDDVSRFGTEASDLAPGLLPKMDSVASAVREVRHARRDKKDAEAIAAPIFEGTLYEENGEIVGRVWSDDELRENYALNDRQIDLYRQFRAAVDHSLETLAIAEMTKVARAYAEAKNPDDIVLTPPAEELGMHDLAKHYTNQFEDRIRDAMDRMVRLRARMLSDREVMAENASKLGYGRVKFHEVMSKKEAADRAEMDAIEAEIKEMSDLKNAFTGKASTINKLQQQGYAPLMRFGKYTVDVLSKRPALDADGNEVRDSATGDVLMEEFRPFFGMFESEREAQEVAAVMREEYPDAAVTTGVGSQDGYQLFGSVSLDSLEALAKLAGKEEDEFVQKFYKEAVSQRSALKRLIHRKGIAGYNQDVTRSLAAFVMSNARATASAYHFGDLMRVTAEIPKEKGDVKDEAVRLINYIRDPNEEAGALRGMLFMHFLGGSIAAAAVNLSQTVMTTAPYLHQFGVSPKDMGGAAVMAVKRMRGKDLKDISTSLRGALQRAEDEGVVAPHNIHALMGQAGVQTFMGNRVFRMASHLWGSFFSMAEQYNREVAFIAAYQAAEKMGRGGLLSAYRRAAEIAESRGVPKPDFSTFADPYAFAKNAVQETQFVLSKAARPNWARGTVGATLMTFKQFMIFYMELLKRLPNKERAMMLGTLIVLAGAGGLPGADDLDDLIDTVGQSLGYNTNAKRWKDDAAREIFGAKGGEFVTDGISAFIPLEIGSRLGMGNILPATGLLKPSNAGRRDAVAMEVLGAAGGYYKNLMNAADYLQRGRYGQAFAEAAAPKAIKDLVKAYEMQETGVYDDTRGRRVVDVSSMDAFWKAIGFQPREVSSVQQNKAIQMQDISLFKAVKANIAEMLAQAIHERDAGKRERALSLLADWNEKNPEHRMKRPEAPSIARRVRAMRLSASDRMQKTTPKEIREMQATTAAG